MSETVPACPVCDGTNTAPEPFYYLWQATRWVLHRCRACTHQFVWPHVSAKEQQIIYADRYFSEAGDWQVGLTDKSYVEAEADLREEARLVLSMLPRHERTLLDIGCAGGTFLNEAQRAGFHRVAGIEYNTTQAQSARDRYGLTVHAGAIEEQPLDLFDDAPFGVVTVLDCLEHLPNPRALMERIARWTVSESVLLIRGPLSNSPWANVKETVRRLVGRSKQLDGYPLDAGMYNPKSLATLVSAYGFRVERWVHRTDSFANMIAVKQ